MTHTHWTNMNVTSQMTAETWQQSIRRRHSSSLQTQTCRWWRNNSNSWITVRHPPTGPEIPRPPTHSTSSVLHMDWYWWSILFPPQPGWTRGVVTASVSTEPWPVLSVHQLPQTRTDRHTEKKSHILLNLSQSYKKPDSRPVHSDIGCVSLAHIAASPLIHQWLSESTRRDPEQDLHIQRHLTRFPVLSQLLFSFCHRHQWNNTKYLYTHFRLWKLTLTLTVHTQTTQLWLQHSLH